jgi:uncharacterized protein YjeT (DUF2065 family)
MASGFWKIVGIALVSALVVNGFVMAFFPNHFRRVPWWIRMHGVFNVSYGSRGGANQYPISPWQIRLKGAFYLLIVVLVLWSLFRR